MSLKGIAEGIVSLSQARTAHEKRIAFLENEIRRLKSVLDGLLGASQLGSPEGEIEENEDSLGLGTGIPKSVSAVNSPGQSMKPSLPPDHEHQGVYAINVNNSCQGMMEGVPAVNRISFVERAEDAVFLYFESKLVPAIENPFVPDANNKFGPLNPNVPGDGEDIYDGMDIYVGHYPVPIVMGGASPNTNEGGEAICESPCGSSRATAKEMVAESECSGWLRFAGRTTIDCFGHVHVMNNYLLKVSTVLEDATSIDCCASEETTVLSDVSLSCVVTGGPGTNNRQFEYKLTFDRVKFRLPENLWTIAADESPGSDQIQVITNIVKTARVDCDCSYEFSVTKGLALKTAGAPSSTTVDVVIGVCYDSSSCEIQIKKQTLTVLAKGTTTGPTSITGTC